MPCNYKDYPKNWKTEIRPAVLARAFDKCEVCGVMNKSRGARDYLGRWVSERTINNLKSDDGEHLFQHINGFPNIITIVLTVAHLDHDVSNHDVSLDRLQAMCQKCHLNNDKEIHMVNRTATLKKKKGIIELFQ